MFEVRKISKFHLYKNYYLYYVLVLEGLEMSVAKYMG